MEPRHTQHHTAGGEAATVVFNVGGRYFEVLRQTIQSCASTLLASLSEDIGTDAAQPIFVDANPDRFGHILDWYRFGEMHLPSDCPIAGVLRDARFFLLPDFVRINGSLQQVCPNPANDACDAGVVRVIDHWPGFVEYVSGIVAELRRDLHTAGEGAADVQDDVSSCGSVTAVNDRVLPTQRVVLTKWCEQSMCHVWADQRNVCNRLRLAALLSELARRGLHCSITTASYNCRRCGRHASRCSCSSSRFSTCQLELVVGHQVGGSGWPA